MKNLVQKIVQKPLWQNILIGIGFLFFLLIVFFLSLGWITGYGKTAKVVSVVGQSYVAAQQQLEKEGFEVVILDSIYVDSIAKLAVIRQTPEADEIVKAGRTIYLTINRMVPPQVEMPSLVGFSLKSAELYLQSLQLKLGAVTYKPDFARNAVLDQLFNGVPIAQGVKIPLGSTIGLVIGTGVGGEETDMPNLVGLTYVDAKNLLSLQHINIGSVLSLETIKDSATSFVFRQTPGYLSTKLDSLTGMPLPNKIRQGQLVDLYLSNTPPPKDSITNPSIKN
ncbi:MAG: PASTA domain-containing protein [Bacteroidetes bacterium]|jgi:eukaryotic-like serine/threonine-protein kinase|nr:PASTA domain-containing protein [Bacteroidota bacterium]